MLRSGGLVLAIVVLCQLELTKLALGSLLGDYTPNKHWKALHNARGAIGCDKNALNAWLFFGEQRKIGDKFKADDLEEFARSCDYHKLLDEKFTRSEARVYESVRRPLHEFLSEEFIEQYQRDNGPDAPPVHLGSVLEPVEQRCCNPDARSEGASRQAIKRLAAKEGSKLAKIMSQHKGGELKTALEEYFEINVAITCETYWQMLDHHLFKGLMGAMNKFANGDSTFITRQSSEFRAGVFRYQFCRRLASEQQLRSKYIKALATIGSEP